MEEQGDVFILLKDKQGEKCTNVVVGALFGGIPCNVLRGEMAIKIPEKRKSGQYNHQTVHTDQPAMFFDSVENSDLAPLLGNQAGLLAGVKTRDERYQLFITGKLEWGSTLKVNNPVMVSLNNLQPTETEATPKAMALIQYVGPVKGEKGIVFGVEIADKHFLGQGTTDGTFQGERYFACRDGNGMFVSLDRLSEISTGYSAKHNSQPSHPAAQAGGKKEGKGREKPSRFKVDDRVVAFKEDGTPVRGTVKWVGPYTLQDEKKQQFSVPAVGIETDVRIMGTDMESCLPAKHQYFTVGKKKSHLFMREEEVILEEDFGVEESKPSRKPHQSPIPRIRSPPQQPRAQPHADHQKKRQMPETAPPDAVRLPQQAKDEPLNPEDPSRFAQQMGSTSHTEFLKEQSELLQRAAKEKEERELKEVKEALNVPPDQSLHQEQLFHKLSAENQNVEQQKINSSIPKPPRRPEHIYDVPLPPSPKPAAAQVRPPGQYYHQPSSSQPDPLSNASGGPSAGGIVGDSSFGGHTGGYAGTIDAAGQAMNVQHSPNLQNVGQTMAYAGNPAQPVPTGLGVGSPVQLKQDHNRHGVIRWIGNLQETRGLVAGVELDAPLEECGDGEWKGYRYFTCSPGRGFFCPVASLIPDPRVEHGGHTVVNPLSSVPDEEEQDQNIQGDQIVKYTGEGRGIQGHQNSCYLDATIFGLFALSDVFDSLFLDHMRSLTSLQSPTATSPTQREVGTMLWKGIVNPLRKYGVVKFESVMRLRNKLEELGKMEGVNTKEKDPEEFLNMLFKHTLHVDPFIHIKRPFGTEPEFFVQLFVEFDESIKVPTIEKLLIKMFREQHISFAEVPSKLLVQVPRYGREFQAYKRIIPGIKFDTTSLLETSKTCYICGDPARMTCTQCSSGKDFRSEEVNFCNHCSSQVHRHKDRVGHNPVMCPGLEGLAVELELLSVLCIETSHYVCFSRDSEGRWLFFDSMADRLYDQFNIPRGVDCTAMLNEWVYEGDQERLMAAGPRELPELVRRFTQDVYMCVYIQPDYGMYG